MRKYEVGAVKKLKNMNRGSRRNILTCAFVAAAYVILQLWAGAGMSSSLKGMLVPICAYVVMAV